MKSRSLVLPVLLCFFGYLSCDPFGTASGQTSTTSVPGRTTEVPQFASIEDVIEDMESAVRKMDTVTEVTIPTELPRFQKADALDVELKTNKKTIWNDKVEKLEAIIQMLKRLPKRIKKMNTLAAELRAIYIQAKAEEAAK